MNIVFTKMQGLGNDFILIDCRGTEAGVWPGFADNPELGEISRKLCDRRFGVGADQLLLLYPSEIADFHMRIFNSDGSEVEMCGNGIRCFAKYIWDRGLSDKNRLEVETLAGIIIAERVGLLIRVDMGEPILEAELIPVKLSRLSAVSSQQSAEAETDFSPTTHKSSPIVNYPLQVADKELRITCVSMGNPHAVIVVDNLAAFNIAYYGSLLEKHPIFPNKTNTEFIEVLNASEVRMRVWERGAGETMACGTGASAVVVAASLLGLISKKAIVHLAGGDLSVEWRPDNHVYMTGPAEEVFAGNINLREEYAGKS